jgi:hypothetical protein
MPSDRVGVANKRNVWKCKQVQTQLHAFCFLRLWFESKRVQGRPRHKGSDSEFFATQRVRACKFRLKTFLFVGLLYEASVCLKPNFTSCAQKKKALAQCYCKKRNVSQCKLSCRPFVVCFFGVCDAKVPKQKGPN